MRQAQPTRDEDAVEKIETGLHQKREECGWNCALQDGGVIVQV